jgi:hypothetical protein
MDAWELHEKRHPGGRICIYSNTELGGGVPFAFVHMSTWGTLVVALHGPAVKHQPGVIVA